MRPLIGEPILRPSPLEFSQILCGERFGLAGRRAKIALDGGELDILWRQDGHVMMTGPATLAFEGRFDPALLGR